MKFNRLEVDKDNPKIKYISVKKYFDEIGCIKYEYVKKSFEFAYSMTFGSKGQHRSYRSGGRHRRKNGEIFANTFQGKLCEFAVYQTLNETHDINEPDLEVYELGKWDKYDFKIDDLITSIKSTKYFGQLLLLETKDWTLDAKYIPNNNEHYDITIMVRLEDEIEQTMKRNRLYYSQMCDKTKLWDKFESNNWAFDIPGYLTYEDLKYLINNKFIINRGDLLNGRTRMDAQNYYCHIADMRNILDLEKINE